MNLLIISRKYLLIIKVVEANRLEDPFITEVDNSNNNNDNNNGNDNNRHFNPPLYKLESYHLHNRPISSNNIGPPLNFFTSSSVSSSASSQQEYLPITELVNLSYPSAVHENKWNAYLNSVNNQYINNSRRSSSRISNNQSYRTSISNNSFDPLSASPPPESLSSSSLGIESTIKSDLAYAHLTGESRTEQILKHILTNYKSHQRPNENSLDPTIVTVNMQIIDISSSNVVRMEYTMNCYLRQQWIDPRLAWEANPVLNSSVSNLLLNQQKKQLWLPDLFFRNGKSGFLHHISQPNFLLRVKSNGQVLYSQKITMVLACQMYLKNFPMDRQECTVDIGSYGYTIDQLKFIWHHEKPVTISDELQLLEFERPQKTFTTVSQ
ncbi:unnamed protein product [Trichobilharzia szidati]|nr:unnamed protein product [Trichobilharzia szidati]